MMLAPIAVVVLTQERHHILGVRTFWEAGEPAQVAEERGYLSTMALQLLLGPRSDDQISRLRRQEAPQPAHALYLAHLVGDASKPIGGDVGTNTGVGSSKEASVLSGSFCAHWWLTAPDVTDVPTTEPDPAFKGVFRVVLLKLHRCPLVHRSPPGLLKWSRTAHQCLSYGHKRKP
jgi:hypothetical protein